MADGANGSLASALRLSEELGYDAAWSMPKSYYTDPEILQLERDH